MKCRVYYKPDGTVSIVYPAPKARLSGESDADFLNRICIKACQGTALAGCDFEDIDPSVLPARKDREKWRGTKAAGLKVDTTVTTIAEKRQAVEASLDAELLKSVPDAVNVIRLQRQLDKGAY